MADYSDLDRQIEQLKRCEIIRETEVKALCAKAREILVEEGNVQRVDSPVTVSFASKYFLFLFGKIFADFSKQNDARYNDDAIRFSFFLTGLWRYPWPIL